MYSIHHTSLSRKDMKDIWKYIAKDNLKAADQLVRHVAQRIAILSEMPEIGKARNELYPKIRQLIVGNYIIFYHVDNEQESVYIRRIIHGARHLPGMDIS